MTITADDLRAIKVGDVITLRDGSNDVVVKAAHRYSYVDITRKRSAFSVCYSYEKCGALTRKIMPTKTDIIALLDYVEASETENARLKASNERLREALEDMLYGVCSRNDESCSQPEHVSARGALAEAKGEIDDRSNEAKRGERAS